MITITIKNNMVFVTFMVEGRTGNNLFQYLACKIIEKKYGHTYVPINEIENVNAMLMQSKFGGDHCPEELLTNLLVVYENDMEKLLNDGGFSEPLGIENPRSSIDIALRAISTDDVYIT